MLGLRILSTFLFASTSFAQTVTLHTFNSDVFERVRDLKSLEKRMGVIQMRTTAEIQIYSKTKTPIDPTYVKDLIALVELDSFRQGLLPAGNLPEKQKNWRDLMAALKEKGKLSELPTWGKEIVSFINNLDKTTDPTAWRTFLFNSIDIFPTQATGYIFAFVLQLKCHNQLTWSQFEEATKCYDQVISMLTRAKKLPDMFLVRDRIRALIMGGNLVALKKYLASETKEHATDIFQDSTLISALIDQASKNYDSSLAKIRTLQSHWQTSTAPRARQVLTHIKLLEIFMLLEKQNLPVAIAALEQFKIQLAKNLNPEIQNELNTLDSIILAKQKRLEPALAAIQKVPTFPAYPVFYSSVLTQTWKCALKSRLKQNQSDCTQLSKDLSLLVKSNTGMGWPITKSIELLALSSKSALTAADKTQLKSIEDEISKYAGSDTLVAAASLLREL